MTARPMHRVATLFTGRVATLILTGVTLLVGIASAALVSWLAIAWLLRFLQQHSTWWFVGYRLFFGLGLILCANRLAG